MSTVSKLIKELQKLEAQGYGNAQVFYRHGASGDCGPLSSPRATSEVDNECGPFDLDDGEVYVQIYAGN